MSKDWMMTFTGKHVFPLDVKAADIDIVDIGHSLAMQCRYNGHTANFYSVAEHAYLISLALERDGHDRVTCLTGLLHDAAETYVGDIIRPLKNSLNNATKPAELKIEAAVSEHFNLPFPWPDEIHEYDHRIIADEKDSVLLFGPHKPWVWNMKHLGVKIECLAPHEARSYFMHRYEYLTK